MDKVTASGEAESQASESGATRPDFDELTRVVRSAVGYEVLFRKETEIWGVNGGYLAAAMVRAAALEAAGGRPLSITCQFYQRVRLGRATLEVKRAFGHGIVEAFSVSLLAEGVLRASATVWFIADRELEEQCEHDFAHMPLVPQPEELREPGELPAPPGMPFWKNFEHKRMNTFRASERNHKNPRLLRWVRHYPVANFDDEVIDCCRVLPLIDSLWMNAALLVHPDGQLLKGRTPTLELSVCFVREVRGHEWLLIQSECELALRGILRASGRIWSTRGELLAEGVCTMLRTQSAVGAITGIPTARS